METNDFVTLPILNRSAPRIGAPVLRSRVPLVTVQT